MNAGALRSQPTCSTRAGRFPGISQLWMRPTSRLFSRETGGTFLACNLRSKYGIAATALLPQQLPKLILIPISKHIGKLLKNMVFKLRGL